MLYEERRLKTRDNIRLRVFVHDKKEIYEIYSEYAGETVREYRREVPLGESAADFLYTNALIDGVFENLRLSESAIARINESPTDEKAWLNLLLGFQYCAEYHPYFAFIRAGLDKCYCASKNHAVRAGNTDLDFLARLDTVYANIKSDMQELISNCLSTEIDDDIPHVVRYLAASDAGKLKIPGALTFSRTTGEIESATRFNRVNDGKDRLFDAVVPAKEVAREMPVAAFETLYPESPEDIYRYMVTQYLKHDVKFKPCKNCGRYFPIVRASKAEYCNRVILGSEKTCRQAGAIRIYQSKKLEDPAVRAYTRAYKTRNARIRYGSMTRDEFAAWAVEARKMRDKCVAGEMPLKVLEEWLGEG